jgi:hypothetical protein
MTISPNKWELDVQGYLNTCNISAATPRQQIRDFAKGVNDLGLWNSMVCWPLRSSQNYGSGDTVFSLGGLGAFNGTRVGGPTWGANGITSTAASSHEITTSFARPDSVSMFFVGAQNLVTSYATPLGFLNRGYSISSDGDAVRNLTLRSNGGGGSSGAAAVQTTEQNVYLMLGATGTGTSVATWKNGANKLTATLTSTPNQNNNLNFGRHEISGYSFWDGTSAFGMVVNSVVADSAIPQIYEVYKTTLGTGLGLP